MAPLNRYEFVILRLTYIGRHENFDENPSEDQEPINYVDGIRAWFHDAMMHEMHQVPLNNKVRYSEWCFTSKYEELFTIGGNRFDKMMFIMGDEMVHYIFYNTKTRRPNLVGCAKLPVSYCSCCINIHYDKVVEAVRQDLHNKLSLNLCDLC